VCSCGSYAATERSCECALERVNSDEAGEAAGKCSAAAVQCSHWCVCDVCDVCDVCAYIYIYVYMYVCVCVSVRVCVCVCVVSLLVGWLVGCVLLLLLLIK
jgi:hypothetical protein